MGKQQLTFVSMIVVAFVEVLASWNRKERVLSLHNLLHKLQEEVDKLQKTKMVHNLHKEQRREQEVEVEDHQPLALNASMNLMRK